MKKVKKLMMVLMVVLSITACGVNPGTTQEKKVEKTKTTTEKIKTSPDKYTWYVKDYVGKNVASFGYTSLGGDRMDHYGEGVVKLILVTSEGKYINIENEDEMKKYVVTNQNVSPNTEIKYTFEKNEEGEEESFVENQTLEELVLSVEKIGKEKEEFDLTEIHNSPDKYTWYIRDYVGRNLAMCGYTSLGGDYRDAYGETTVKLILTAEDGSYIDIEDEEILKKYKVTGQNIAPNTEMKLEFSKDENGEEDGTFVEGQNIEEIELSVSLVEE